VIVSALFLIGLFFSISCYLIVRLCAFIRNGFSNKSGHCTVMLPASELGRGENPRLNLAFPNKGGISSIRNERVVPQAEFPKVKARLLEVHSLGTKITGLQRVLYRLYVSSKDLL
jgi:hypothetical protein